MLIARLLLAPAFLVSGVEKLAHPVAGIAEVAASGLAPVTLFWMLTVTVQLGAGLSVLLGIQARLGALALCAFLVPVTLLYYPFWAVGPERLDGELNRFLSNLGLIGGFLVVVVFGAGRFSLEDRPLTQATLTHFHSLRHGAPARRSQAGT